jgi:hypothetical protein
MSCISCLFAENADVADDRLSLRRKGSSAKLFSKMELAELHARLQTFFSD